MKYELIVKYKYTITITTKPNIIKAEECDWGGGGAYAPLAHATGYMYILSVTANIL